MLSDKLMYPVDSSGRIEGVLLPIESIWKTSRGSFRLSAPTIVAKREISLTAGIESLTGILKVYPTENTADSTIVIVGSVSIGWMKSFSGDNSLNSF